MPITFNCACGQVLTADDERGGNPTYCPSCRQWPVVPNQSSDSPTAASTSAKPWRQGEPNNFAGESQTAKASSGRSLEGNILNSGVVGGALAMIVAVIWFIVGLAGDVIFFYPPILFIIGLVSFFKGLAGSGSQE